MDEVQNKVVINHSRESCKNVKGMCVTGKRYPLKKYARGLV